MGAHITHGSRRACRALTACRLAPHLPGFFVCKLKKLSNAKKGSGEDEEGKGDSDEGKDNKGAMTTPMRLRAKRRPRS